MILIPILILLLICFISYYLYSTFIEAEVKVNAIKEADFKADETGSIEWEVINLGDKKFKTKEI